MANDDQKKKNRKIDRIMHYSMRYSKIVKTDLDTAVPFVIEAIKSIPEGKDTDRVIFAAFEEFDRIAGAKPIKDMVAVAIKVYDAAEAA